MTGRYVHAIWCDDIRLEIGNKPSFMGVYVGGITLGSLPVVLPRLAVYIWICTSIDDPFKKILLRVIRDDGFTLAEVCPHIPEDQTVPSVDSRCDLIRSMIMAGVTLNGVEIPEGCKYFRILVDTESETLEGPKLHIDINPERFAQANPGYTPPLADSSASDT